MASVYERLSRRSLRMTIDPQDKVHEFDQFQNVDENEIQKIIGNIVKKCCAGIKEWDPDHIEPLLHTIGHNYTEELVTLAKPFKFVVFLEVYPKMGAAMEIAHIQHWEPKKDGWTKFTWANNYMNLIITTYWVFV